MGGHNGIKSDLLANSGTANDLSKTYAANAAGINSALTPALETEATHPQGYDPTALASMRTSAEQSAGGGYSGAAGRSMLRANRTRNIGSGQAGIADANHTASEEMSNVDAGIEGKNADLKAHQQQAGLSGLGSLYGENVGAGENALGLSDTALNEGGNLHNFWQDLLKQGVQSGGQVAGSYFGG